MYRTYLYGRLNHKATSVKLFSVKKGEISINTLEDAMIYADSQGLYYQEYLDKGTTVYYALELAKLLKLERQYWLAAKCYFEALDQSWRDYINYALYGKAKQYRRILTPKEVSNFALDYFEWVKRSDWAREFKYENLKWKNYFDSLLRENDGTLLKQEGK